MSSVFLRSAAPCGFALGFVILRGVAVTLALGQRPAPGGYTGEQHKADNQKQGHFGWIVHNALLGGLCFGGFGGVGAGGAVAMYNLLNVVEQGFVMAVEAVVQ